MEISYVNQKEITCLLSLNTHVGSDTWFHSSGVYICKSIVNDLRYGNYICKSEGIHLEFPSSIDFCTAVRKYGTHFSDLVIL